MRKPRIAERTASQTALRRVRVITGAFVGYSVQLIRVRRHLYPIEARSLTASRSLENGTHVCGVPQGPLYHEELARHTVYTFDAAPNSTLICFVFSFCMFTVYYSNGYTCSGMFFYSRIGEQRLSRKYFSVQ